MVNKIKKNQKDIKCIKVDNLNIQDKNLILVNPYILINLKIMIKMLKA